MMFHTEVLPPDQQIALRKTAAISTEIGCYLAGGTAVAAHVGHRQSVDLDWFTDRPLDEPMQLAERLIQAGIEFTTTGVQRGTLQGMVNGVRVSWIEFRYPSLHAPATWPEFGCSVASLPDLASMKLLAATQRGAKRDFVDIYYLGLAGMPLSTMLDCYQRRFHIEDVGRVLFSLAYFDDADRQPPPTMLTKVDWEEVKSVIRAWVQTYSDAE